jgi:phage-related protein
MNKIFTLRSPLYIKYPNGETRVIEEIFQHPEGILYFELFWEKDPRYSIHLIKGNTQAQRYPVYQRLKTGNNTLKSTVSREIARSVTASLPACLSQKAFCILNYFGKKTQDTVFI